MKSEKSTSHILIGLALLLILWTGSYGALSRRGYAEAVRWNSDGFHYLTPENTDAWRRSEAICTYAFWPLNFVDRSIGTGREHSAEPLWDLN
jgi:hypothetical protein